MGKKCKALGCTEVIGLLGSVVGGCLAPVNKRIKSAPSNSGSRVGLQLEAGVLGSFPRLIKKKKDWSNNGIEEVGGGSYDAML